MNESRHSLRRNGGKVSFEQLSQSEVKSLITQWISNGRNEVVRAELAEILLQLAGVTGGAADGVVESGTLTGNSLTLSRSIGANVVVPVNLNGQTQVSALQDKVVTGIAFSGDATKTLTLTFDDGTTLTANFTDNDAGGGGASESTYELLSGDVIVTGTAGITAAFSGGVFTITVPAGGLLRDYEVNVEAADATYANGTVTDAVKLVIDNSANNDGDNGNDASTAGHPQFLARTAAGAITAGNPLQWNTAINTAVQSDEWAGGVRSWIFQQVSSNASAGGIIKG